MAKDSDELEILVAKIQQQLAPDAEVIQDAKLLGRKTNVKRQIDVLVREKIGQYEILIILECKDHKKPVDVKGVEEFHGLLEDVGGHKGAMICPKGFTSTAKTRAEGLQVDLYSPVDTDPHKWQCEVTVPAICDFRSAAISFGFATTEPVPFLLPYNFYDTEIVYNTDQEQLEVPSQVALRKWNEGHFPIEPGLHQDLSIFDQPEVLMESGYGRPMKATLTVSLRVEQHLYFGHLPVPHISGFKDELSGAIITNAFTIGFLDPNDVEKNWLRIDSIEDAPAPYFATFRGLVGYEES